MFPPESNRKALPIMVPDGPKSDGAPTRTLLVYADRETERPKSIGPARFPGWNVWRRLPEESNRNASPRKSPRPGAPTRIFLPLLEIATDTAKWAFCGIGSLNV